jgi:hypothetical protein
MSSIKKMIVPDYLAMRHNLNPLPAKPIFLQLRQISLEKDCLERIVVRNHHICFKLSIASGKSEYMIL